MRSLCLYSGLKKRGGFEKPPLSIRYSCFERAYFFSGAAGAGAAGAAASGAGAAGAAASGAFCSAAGAGTGASSFFLQPMATLKLTSNITANTREKIFRIVFTSFFQGKKIYCYLAATTKPGEL
jgi:hypothetical protein